MPPNPALVTFDDGYLECHDVVLPLLREHRVPATFFIATDYVENRRVFWWDRIAWLIDRATQPRFELTYPETLAIDLAAGRAATVRRLQRVVKETYDLHLERFLVELGEASGAPWDRGIEEEIADRLVMSWGHVRALRDAGMAVGSHTRTHRVLQTVPLADLEGELTGSRQDLERVLGEPVRTLAYPVGRPIDDVPGIRPAVVAAGYELAFTYCTGMQPLREIDALSVRRLAPEADWTLCRFRANVAFPALA